MYKTLINSILLVSSCVLSNIAFSNEDDIRTDSNYATIGDLHFSLAIGVGEKTNPLVGGDDIPLYLVPSLRYYGDNFFFDNGDVGYSFFDNDKFVVSAIARINGENAHFSRWHPKNVFVFEATGDNSNVSTTPDFNPDGGSETEGTKINIKDIKDRKWALDAGLMINWFPTDTLSIRSQLLHDINGIYDGFNGKIEAFYQPENVWSDHVVLQFTAGIDWSSAAMADYYYGIDQSDTPDKSLFYSVGSSFNPYAKVFAGYKLTDHWRLFFSVNYKRLDKAIQDSPIVKDSDIVTTFVGASYVF